MMGFDIPVWYPWGDLEEKTIRGWKARAFMAPSPEQLANAVTLNWYDTVPPSAPVPLPPTATNVTPYQSPPHYPVPLRPPTPPSPGSSQEPGQTCQELFKARDELWAGRVESEKDHERRENRERQPPTKHARWFEWRANSAGILIRHRLTRRESEDAFDSYIAPHQCRYHARSNGWDFCDDFDQKPPPHDLTSPMIGDYDDDEFYEDYHPEPFAPIAPIASPDLFKVLPSSTSVGLTEVPPPNLCDILSTRYGFIPRPANLQHRLALRQAV